MGDKTNDLRSWHIARHKTLSRDERSQRQLQYYDRAGKSLLSNIAEELGHSRFSFEEMCEVVGSYCFPNSENLQGEMRAALNNLLKRELIEEIDDNLFEISIEGFVVTEYIPEGMKNRFNDG